ncbi:DNA repair protein REV1 [Impatiens glandulifera]|uniref:DNA repair protein REV1 n=1 Tax=Impatiens glandulifera TaxID=253017 RepID=UPI001FB07C69|nr:DNA repair protein REV1 [Impatiens glandulifera]
MRSHNSNSICSNNSSTSNDKKRKASQKTLGMAWGANSRSASRSSFRSSPFSDVGSYMVAKNRKLQDQFNAEASCSTTSSNGKKPIFHGVSIFVDGFTIPSSQELRAYMLKNGGRFENYFSRNSVTHIICSNLPNSKIKNLRSFSGGLPVVKPTWISDSFAANKLLSWIPYQLDQLANETHNQSKLLSFFTTKSSGINNDVPTCMTDEIETKDVNHPTFEVGEGEDDNLNVSVNHAVVEEVMVNGRVHNDENSYEPRNTSLVDQISSRGESTSAQSQSSASESVQESATSAAVGPPKQHTTLADPSFVENYFKYSRLHFIGTWRRRYRKRFPNLSSGFQQTSSGHNPVKSSIIHVDMDCFFVSVVIRKHPELRNEPVAVCHSDTPRGTAEISSANYPARNYGIRAGMFVGDAKDLCPQLVVLPYDFEAYEEVADQFYNILHKHCNKVQAVSCDEAFLDATDSVVDDPQLLASLIREEIWKTTGCSASAGIAGNLLIARLATRTAKPNNQCYIPSDKVNDYLRDLPIKALPGIGHVLEEKLKAQEIKTCGELCMISKESLQRDFGSKTGEMLWNCSRGIDNRPVGVLQESKSIGAEVNWGVRLKNSRDAQTFLLNLCKEVSLRMHGCSVEGRTFTLKIKKRKRGAKEPIKYMGHGDCENISHSLTIPMATCDVEVIQRVSSQLYGCFNIAVQDIRGMGLQVSKLESSDAGTKGRQRNSILTWCTSKIGGPTTIGSAKEENKGSERQSINRNPNDARPSNQISTNYSDTDRRDNRGLVLPPLDDVDLDVVRSLPSEVLSEINDMYGGKLTELITVNKNRNEHTSNSLCDSSHKTTHDEIYGTKGPLDSSIAFSSEFPSIKEEIQSFAVSESGCANLDISTSSTDIMDLMPSSLSQVDTSVFQQLPETLKFDILKQLPAHRKVDSIGAEPQESSHARLSENQNLSLHTLSSLKDLWTGKPPRWVHIFRNNNCRILHFLSDMYYTSGTTGSLSSILQRSLLGPPSLLEASDSEGTNDVRCLFELLKQYVEIIMESDIEEIYVCFRLLKRLAVKSKVLQQVYDDVLPHLQASAGEIYGGSLQL